MAIKKTSAKQAAPRKQPAAKMPAAKKSTAKKPAAKKAAQSKAPPRKRNASKTKSRSKAKPQPTHEMETSYGALVGWASDDLGNRIRLRMQSTKTTPKSPEDIEEVHYYMDKDQAALLGNFLFRVSGKTAPEPSSMPMWLRKLLKPKP